MNLQQLQDSNKIIFSCVAGSHAYGTFTPESDKDIRGIYINPDHDYLGLFEPQNQISDEKNDITYYSTKRFFELAMTANPNIIELLYIPEDCVSIKTELMQKIIDNRDMFISKKCYYSHSGYAYAQIKKAKGQHKMVHNPQPETMPVKEDFCWVIEKADMDGQYTENASLSTFPMRPKRLSEHCMDLSKYHVSSLEHCQNVYRLYKMGDKAKGVFRGDNMLVCESISIDEEFDNFAGVLIYNQAEYEQAVKSWHTYWDWVRNRNDQRWLDQEKGLLNYDSKNMLHCMRLLLSGENILRHGYPLVRFEGEQRKHLMDIRYGRLPYEEVMAEVDKKMVELEELYKTSTIPYEVNTNKIDDFYRELNSRNS